MRILLDSRDLINVLEAKGPISVAALESYLYRGNHEIVLCFSNVRELVSPVVNGTPYLDIRPHLQTLERLPHTYMKEVGIVAIELRAAVRAFTAGAEFQNPSPYVNRWDQTLAPLPGGRRSTADYTLNLSLDNLVFLTYTANPGVFAPPREYLAPLKKIIENDRTLLRAGRLPAKQHFINSVKKHGATHHVILPAGREDELALWIYRDPDRCPGLRLSHEIFRSITANYDDVPEAGDFTDMALTFAVPYVDASTLDRRFRDYCRRACRKLCKLNVTHDYRERVYEDIADLLRRT